MPYGTIGRTGPEMRQVEGFGIGSRERVLLRANLGRAIVTDGDFTARRTCATVPQPSELPFGVDVRPVGRGIAVLHGVHDVQGEGKVLFPIFTMGNAIASPTVRCFRFVCENLTFPFGKHIVGELDSFIHSFIHTIYSINSNQKQHNDKREYS